MEQLVTPAIDTIVKHVKKNKEKISSDILAPLLTEFKLMLAPFYGFLIFLLCMIILIQVKTYYDLRNGLIKVVYQRENE